jgi:hypothetical protein
MANDLLAKKQFCIGTKHLERIICVKKRQVKYKRVMGNFKLNMIGANRTVYFDPKIDQIATCDLANLV